MKPIEVIIKYLIWHFGGAETLTRYIIENYMENFHLSKNPPKGIPKTKKAP
jgi:hypothetical protein